MTTNVDQGFFTNEKFQPKTLTSQKTAGAKCLSLYSVNVEAMAHAEVSEAKTVLARIDERRASKMAAAAQAAEEGAMFPDPVSQHRPHHHHRHHRHHHRPKRRSSGSGSLPPAEASPLKQAQLLRQRKESTAAAAAAQGVAGKASNGGREAGGLAVPQVGETGRRGGRPEDDREGGGSIGGSAFPGDARSMALEAASEGLGGYSRSSCSSEGTRWAGCHAIHVVVDPRRRVILSFGEIRHFRSHYQRPPGVSFTRKTLEGGLVLANNLTTMNLTRHSRKYAIYTIAHYKCIPPWRPGNPFHPPASKHVNFPKQLLHVFEGPWR